MTTTGIGSRPRKTHCNVATLRQMQGVLLPPQTVLNASPSVLIKRALRSFLIQSDLSVENGRFRLKPKSSFLIQSKKGFFDSIFFD